MSTKTEQDLHVAAELALFTTRDRRFRCRGSQEQDLAKVLARIERNARSAERSADHKGRQAAAAKAAEKPGEAAKLARAALTQRAAAKKIDVLAGVVLDAALKLKPHVEGDVGTEHVVSFLLQVGRDAQAAELNKQARVGCGGDLRQVIAQLPRPCESEPYTCPQCGRVGHASKTAHAEVAEASE